jgi:hypothetical protein
MGSESEGATEELWSDCPLFAPDASLVPNLADNPSAEHVSPAVAALSHLLYDEDTPQEVAEQLRARGNTLFKHGCTKSYRRAVAAYTEALQVPCDVPEVRSALYANRAAAQLKLQNYGRALADAEAALQLDPDHVKSRYRAAVCANALAKWEAAVRHCNAGLDALLRVGLDASPDAALLKRLRMTARGERVKEAAETQARDEGRRRAEAAGSALSRALAKRRVTMGLPLFAQQRAYARAAPTFDADGGGGVLWPVLIVYPEVAGTGVSEQSDYMEQVSEDASVDDIIATLFPKGAPAPRWDVSGAYARRVGQLAAQYRVGWTMRVCEADSDDERDFVGSNLGPDDVGVWKTVPRSTTIAELVRRPDYVVPHFPVIYLVPA